MMLESFVDFIPGLVLGFREGLEAFLLILVLYRFVVSKGNLHARKYVIGGTGASILLSWIIAFALTLLNDFIAKSGQYAKLFETLASFIALGFITYFIWWMVEEGKGSGHAVTQSVSRSTTVMAFFWIAFWGVLREGVEIAIFLYAGRYDLLAVVMGIVLSALLTWAIYYFSWRVPIRWIMRVTLFYLILQAGFLLGYGVHEGLAVARDFAWISADSWVYIKAYNLTNTIFDHSQGLFGVFLYVTIGWYSRPEWIQLLVHVAYVLGIGGWAIQKFKVQQKPSKKAI